MAAAEAKLDTAACALTLRLPHATRLQVVSARLKRHVLKNQDKLIQGITNVTSVDDDVKASCTLIDLMTCLGADAVVSSDGPCTRKPKD